MGRGARIASLALVVAGLGSTGCAAVFRDGKPPVHVVSDPPGALVEVRGKAGAAPADVNVPRAGVTEVRATMNGYDEHHGTVRKHMSLPWLFADIGTCIIPVALCIPIIVDAVSGAWWDVEPTYHARLEPLGLAVPAPLARPAALAPASPPPPVVAASSMSESERKASARAAYQEGIELQGRASYPEALVRFQSAQRIFDAPTHLLHIAQCLALTGKLVEAQESYETLTHRELPASAPEPFRDAIETGRRELGELRPRIPTLRIVVQPAPSTLRNLVLQVNGRPISNEVIGIARPVNPGTYAITAAAWGIPPSKPVQLVLQEGAARAVDIKLGR